MNTKLEKLFEIHEFSAKDKHDFMQIYSLLPSYKKVRVIENFEDIVLSISSLKKQLLTEQEILFGTALKNIEDKLQTIGKERIKAGSRESIALLKKII